MTISAKIGGGTRVGSGTFASARGILASEDITVDSSTVRVDSATTRVDFAPASAGPAGGSIRGGTRITAR